MSLPHDYDPDDNFGQAFGDPADIDEEAAVEALAWQLLLLINPGDEDAALQQFAAYQEGMQHDAGAEPIDLLRDAIDWKAGFFVADDDPRALVEALDELAARYGLRIDWDLDLDDDDADLENAEVPALLATAYDRLREHHYTLWTYETGSAHHAGWMTLQRDDEALALVARALGIHARAGAG